MTESTPNSATSANSTEANATLFVGYISDDLKPPLNWVATFAINNETWIRKLDLVACLFSIMTKIVFEGIQKG